MKNIIHISVILAFISINCLANDTIVFTSKQKKICFINPGFELELPLHRKTSLIINPGIGYNISYPNTSDFTSSGWLYLIAPFVDVQYRFYYNLDKRYTKGFTNPNSANFISIRGLYRGKEITSNFTRTTNNDYSISLNWGFQRVKNKTYYNFDIGPMYYMDFKGDGGIFINLEFNIGRLF
ncbi:MAG TPA: hypothetical protein VE912_17355 [Bacteroidales bacterium]|nr:hypothetical protein [Bacteroidales bacterium]